MFALALLVLAMAHSAGPVILAKHRGTCPECRNPIRVDEPIVETDPRRWVHEECAPTEYEENWGWPDRSEAA